MDILLNHQPMGMIWFFQLSHRRMFLFIRCSFYKLFASLCIIELKSILFKTRKYFRKYRFNNKIEPRLVERLNKSKQKKQETTNSQLAQNRPKSGKIIFRRCGTLL